MKKLLSKLFKQKSKDLQFEKTEKEFICEFDGHKFYKLPASPYYCNLRFFYWIETSEQINKLGVPIAYLYAIADQLEATEPKRLELTKAVLAEWLREFCNKEKWYWFNTTMAMLEAFILVDNEDILKMSNSHNQLKRKIFTDNPDARFFFINLLSIYIRKLIPALKDIDLENSLSGTTQVQQSQFLRIMSHLTSESFGKLMPQNPVE